MSAPKVSSSHESSDSSGRSTANDTGLPRLNINSTSPTRWALQRWHLSWVQVVGQRNSKCRSPKWDTSWPSKKICGQGRGSVDWQVETIWGRTLEITIQDLISSYFWKKATEQFQTRKSYNLADYLKDYRLYSVGNRLEVGQREVGDRSEVCCVDRRDTKELWPRVVEIGVVKQMGVNMVGTWWWENERHHGPPLGLWSQHQDDGNVLTE